MVTRKHLIVPRLPYATAALLPACLDCGEPFAYHLHDGATQCNAWMWAHEGRGCANPAEHHAPRFAVSDQSTVGATS
jgi:hypothetical protein